MEWIITLFALFVATIILLNKYLNWWIKALFTTYYAVVIYLFVKGYKKIHNNYYERYRSTNDYNPNDPADIEALENFWNVQSEFVDSFLAWFHIPLLGLLLFVFIKGVMNGKNKTQKILIILSSIVIGIVYLWLVIMTAMLGYQP
ncbi:hypothetical protein [Domibacillus robiginosus]|uniref:hypothetical protein n=1 Tax=Domibacillus robiginosus TaxID=1071054 RepID=UPI00067A7D2B|nr:hypothetical protein [Domibacillus robiginosus]